MVGCRRARHLSVFVVWTLLTIVVTKSSMSAGAETIRNIAEGSELCFNAPYS